MKNMAIKRYQYIVVLLLCLGAGSLSAQQGDISPQRKQAIDSLALEKVRDLSKYISIVGNKKTQFLITNFSLHLYNICARGALIELNVQQK